MVPRAWPVWILPSSSAASTTYTLLSRAQAPPPPKGMRLLSSNLDDNPKSRQGCDVPKLKHLQARWVRTLPCQGWLQRPPATPLPAQEKAMSRGGALGPDKPPQDGRRVHGWAGGRRAVRRWHLAMSLQDPQPCTLSSPSWGCQQTVPHAFLPNRSHTHPLASHDTWSLSPPPTAALQAGLPRAPASSTPRAPALKGTSPLRKPKARASKRIRFYLQQGPNR